MKNIIAKYTAWIIIAVMFVMLIPGISLRIGAENKNDNVTISVLYNNMENKISEKKFSDTLNEFKNMGVNTVSVMEEDLNYLVSKGLITCIKYNVLGHKYDLESIEISNRIKEVYPDVSYDSYVVIADDESVKEKLKTQLSKRYTESTYTEIGSFNGLDLYLFHDGRKALWDYAIGYNEDIIKGLKDEGFNIALVHKVKNYENTEYLKDIDKIIKEYDVEYLNIKEDSYTYPEAEQNKDNYLGIAKLIEENKMTLVVTENTNQLSNQKCFGYSHIFDTVTKAGGTKKVIRSYETYDESQADETHYKYRTEQFFNSTVDRNIRFITVTLLEPKNIAYEECAEYTLKAVRTYKEKIEKQGFRVNGDINEIDYTANKKLNSAACAVIMIMFMLLAFNMITDKSNLRLTVFSVILSALAFVGTFIIPEGLLSLYPTAYSVVQPCFAITVVLWFIKKMNKKLPSAILAVLSVILMLAVLLIGAVGMGAMLSGLSYYINNDIFRGIKLSLIVPTVYTAIMYYFMFMKSSRSGIIDDVRNVLNAEIKVYWVILAGIIGAIGIYYIVRSGNVNKISGVEQLMRSTLTEIFPARPRTKEFLVGYPALVLLVYYMKNVDIDILKWMLAVGASILATSVTNSFCHVFTDFSVIVTRTLNGLIVGFVVAVIAYIANIVLVKTVRNIINNTEMR